MGFLNKIKKSLELKQNIPKNELDDEDEAKIYQNKANSIKNDF